MFYLYGFAYSEHFIGMEAYIAFVAFCVWIPFT